MGSARKGFMYIETNIERVRELAEAKEDQNWRFRTFLKGVDLSVKELDSIAHPGELPWDLAFGTYRRVPPTDRRWRCILLPAEAVPIPSEQPLHGLRCTS